MSVSKVIVPDNVLDVLLCDECHKYLSVKPVTLDNRRILCGRCSFAGNVNSQYGIFAENALFKCINHFDGCNTLLNYSQVISHEIKCKSENCECILCPAGSLEVPIYMLQYHVKKNHRKSILNTSYFTVMLTDLEMNMFFYRIQNNLFFIKQSFDRLNKSISIEFIKVVKNKGESPIIQIKYSIIYQGGGNIQLNSQPWPYKLNCNSDTNEFKHVAILNDANNNQKVTILFDIEISNLAQFVQSPLTESQMSISHKMEVPVTNQDLRKFSSTLADSMHSAIKQTAASNIGINSPLPETRPYKKFLVSNQGPGLFSSKYDPSAFKKVTATSWEKMQSPTKKTSVDFSAGKQDHFTNQDTSISSPIFDKQTAASPVKMKSPITEASMGVSTGKKLLPSHVDSCPTANILPTGFGFKPIMQPSFTFSKNIAK